MRAQIVCGQQKNQAPVHRAAVPSLSPHEYAAAGRDGEFVRLPRHVVSPFAPQFEWLPDRGSDFEQRRSVAVAGRDRRCRHLESRGGSPNLPPGTTDAAVADSRGFCPAARRLSSLLMRNAGLRG